jgi:hypothetical protein
MTPLRALALATLLAAPLAVHAQAASQPSAAKKELIARIVLAQQGQVDAMARALAGQTSQQVLQVAAQALGQVPADKREALGKDIQADVKRFHDEIEPVLRERAAKLAPGAMGPVLDDKFSEDELKQVAAWLESSAARKFSQFAPDMAGALQQQLVTDTRSTVEPKLQALERSLRKRLGLPDAAAQPSAAASGSAAAKTAPASKATKGHTKH